MNKKLFLLPMGVAALWFAPATFAQDAEQPPAEEAAEEPTEEAVVEEEAAGPVTYSLQASKSALYVLVFNDPDRWTPVTGHDHAITATSFDGTVVWDEDDASACKVEISFPVTALAVDPDGMRARAGLPEDGAIGDGAKKTVVGNMLGKSQLQSSQFPKISYTSSSCSGTSGKVDVSGTLSIRGVGKSVTVPMTIAITDGTFSAKGSFQLGHADFGMKPFTYGPATPKNQEKLVFHVDVVGTAQ